MPVWGSGSSPLPQSWMLKLSCEASDRTTANNLPMRSLDQWDAQIQAILRAGLRGTPLETACAASPADRLAYARSFADDAGHHRVIDPPLLAWVLEIEPWEAPTTDRRDVQLWAALSKPGIDPLSLIESECGPIAPEAKAEGIEVWTEIELASLQALWWHARRSGRPEVSTRARSHARWLMDEIQPDNGTNRPWAIAVFAELAAEGDIDAMLYAETLLHNCQVLLGRPDLLSTVILLDASRLLAASCAAGHEG